MQHAADVVDVGDAVLYAHEDLGVGNRLACGDQLIGDDAHFKVKISEWADGQGHRCATAGAGVG